MSEQQFWENRYATPDYVFGTEPNAFLREQAHLLPKSGRALAVADGEGRNGVWLAQQGLDVLSIDISPNGLAKARDLAAARGAKVQFEQRDIIAWNWPQDAFDVIAVIFIQFARPDERAKIFTGIRKALKPGGLLLMQGYRPEQLAYGTGGPRVADQLYTRALLEQSFAGFASLDIREHDSEVHEGAGHGGMSALIDLVGRK